MKIHTFFYPFLSMLFFCNIPLSALSPPEALQKLKEGNIRYVENKSHSSIRDPNHRETFLTAQTPFAIIVGCSDSRVAPEIIFDQGPGDLFIVRVAGNVIGPLEMESILYAVTYLHPAILIILGHENCGAIQSVIENKVQDIPHIAELIMPSVEKVKKSRSKEPIRDTILANIQNMKKLLQKAPKLQKALREKNIEIQTAYFPFNSGIVEWIETKEN